MHDDSTDGVLEVKGEGAEGDVCRRRCLLSIFTSVESEEPSIGERGRLDDVESG